MALFVTLCAALSSVMGSPVQGEAPPISWVELRPGGGLIVRVITTGACPPVTLPTGRASTTVRARASPDFPVQVCEAALPPSAAGATVSGIPLPGHPPRRVVVVGDTGCRVEGEGTAARAQACHDPLEWSWATIAASAAAWHPDLVIHVGDLLYRESECPAGSAGCRGDPWGYRWATFNADFFAPAAPLLRAAPWVFVRGNHESCARDGDAWFRFLEPRSMPAKCLDYTEPYAIPLGDLQLLVLDSSRADDARVDPERVVPYAAQFAALHRLAGSNAWLVTHIPLWGIRHVETTTGQERLSFDNPLLQAASGNALSPGVKLILAGHIHLFEFLSFTTSRAPQIVVGNGGTLLGPSVTTPLPGLQVAGAQVTAGRVLHQFGYLTLESAGAAWTATLRDTVGMPVLACAIGNLTLSCSP